MEQFINRKLKERGKTKVWLARQIEIEKQKKHPDRHFTRQNLQDKIKRGTWSFLEFLLLLDIFGVDELEILEAVKKMKEVEK